MGEDSDRPADGSPDADESPTRVSLDDVSSASDATGDPEEPAAADGSETDDADDGPDAETGDDPSPATAVDGGSRPDESEGGDAASADADPDEESDAGSDGRSGADGATADGPAPDAEESEDGDGDDGSDEADVSEEDAADDGSEEPSDDGGDEAGDETGTDETGTDEAGEDRIDPDYGDFSYPDDDTGGDPERDGESDPERDAEDDDTKDTDTGDDPTDADADESESEGDAEPVSDEEFEEQLERARERNPPLDREEAVEEEPVEASNGGTATVAGDPREDEMFEGPESDEEMPLAVHIEEMMRRLGVVFLIGGIATLIAFPTAAEMINYLWAAHIPEPWVNRPRLYGPLEYILTKLKVAGLAGVIVGLPVFVYETYLFMRPGLYTNERRYYLAAVPTSLVLGIIGGLFAHFLVLPAIFSYFTTYTEGAAVIAFGLAETFNLIVMLMAMMAVIFQIPLFIQLAIMMNLTTRRWLEDKRLLFWGSFLGVAFLFSPDPTGMAPIIVTLTMIGLFEGTLALLRWTGN